MERSRHPALIDVRGAEALGLVRRHHSARLHARDLVESYRRAIVGLAPGEADAAGVHDACAAALEDRFTLSRTLREAEWRAAGLARQLDDAQDTVAARDRLLAEARDELDRLRAEAGAAVEVDVFPCLPAHLSPCPPSRPSSCSLDRASAPHIGAR